MRNSLLAIATLILTTLQTGYTQDSITVEFPSIIISDVDSKLTVSGLEAGDSLQTSDGKWLKVESQDGEIFVVYRFDKGEELEFASATSANEQPTVIPAWLSILPPLLAIILALVFKEVLSSLFVGIFVGAGILGAYADGFIGFFTGFFRVLDTYILNALADKSHLAVIVFSLTIGSIVALISKNGGMEGVVNRIARFAKNARSGQMATWSLGIAIFFDDYANTLVVGNTMRSITDKLRISREKLAYIVDSTAAPISAIAFVTTWIGAELNYISSGLDKINQDQMQVSEGVYSVFLSSLGYSFYPILALLFIVILIRANKDFGPMLKAERRARKEGIDVSSTLTTKSEMEEFQPVDKTRLKAYNAVIPILVIVFGTLLGLVITGFDSLSAQLAAQGIETTGWASTWAHLGELPTEPTSFSQKLGALIGDSDSYAALLWASLASLSITIVMSIVQRLMGLKDCMEGLMVGFKAMLPAMCILVLAWALAGVTEELKTGDFLTLIMEGRLAPWTVPAITFVMSAVIAFSTGSSWSTMAIVFPLIMMPAWNLSINDGYTTVEALNILYATVASVLAGSVLGDHCSPISDTTILSSLACSCNHVEHVRTQLPYAITVGLVSLVFGIIPSSLGVPFYITLPVCLVALWLIVRFFGRSPEEDPALG